jgi:hypothetical protein
MLASEADYPFRFRNFNRKLETGDWDPFSGAYVQFPGESIKAIVGVAGSLLGADPILVLTDGGVWTMDGEDVISISRPRRVSMYGTQAPDGWAVYDNVLYYADYEGQIRTVNFGAESLSTGQVEDILRGVPAGRKDDINLAAFRDRLYVAYTPSGGTDNTKILVYDFHPDSRGWVRDDLGTKDAEYIFKSRYDGNLYFVTEGDAATAPVVYEHEKSGQTDDAGTAITMTLTTPEFHHNMWENVHVHEVGIICDDDDTGTLTVTRTFKPDGSTAVGQIDLSSTGSNPETWRKDYHATEERRMGGEGASCDITITGDMAGGKKIYGIAANLDVGPSRADTLP